MGYPMATLCAIFFFFFFLIRKLDAIEGDQLLRACRKRLESGTRHD